MAIFGEVMVTLTSSEVVTIMSWSARRTRPLSDRGRDGVYTYECELATDRGNYFFTVEHKYSDGAAELLAKFWIHAASILEGIT